MIHPLPLIVLGVSVALFACALVVRRLCPIPGARLYLIANIVLFSDVLYIGIYATVRGVHRGGWGLVLAPFVVLISLWGAIRVVTFASALWMSFTGRDPGA